MVGVMVVTVVVVMVVVVIMVVILWIAWHWLHRVKLPISWPWVLSYAALIAAVSEALYTASKNINDKIPIHIEVLLPAFALGCILMRPPGCDPHCDDTREGHQEGPESPQEQRVATIIAAVFMVLVGLSMPAVFGGSGGPPADATRITAQMASPGWGLIALHVAAITVLSNLGKMFPLFCYRKEAHWRERLALSVGMWPRGEVGAGVLILSLSYGIGGPIVTVAMLSLAVNLLLTGVFIAIVKKLLGTRLTTAPAGGSGR